MIWLHQATEHSVCSRLHVYSSRSSFTNLRVTTRSLRHKYHISRSLLPAIFFFFLASVFSTRSLDCATLLRQLFRYASVRLATFSLGSCTSQLLSPVPLIILTWHIENITAIKKQLHNLNNVMFRHEFSSCLWYDAKCTRLGSVSVMFILGAIDFDCRAEMFCM